MAKQLPHRSRRYGVGKEIGGAIYIHRSAEDVLPADVIARGRSCFPPGFEYHVVKYDPKSNVVSFVEAPDFDVAPEPSIHRVVTVAPDGSSRLRDLGGRVIYHHKWLFVREGYAGFNTQESQSRSRIILGVRDIDPKRIGSKAYWTTHVLPRITALESSDGS